MPVLCIVPTPLAAARAARRLCDAQDGILFGPTVATLDRLAPGLLAAAADRRAILPPLGERLLAAEAGRAAGGPLAGAAPDSGLAEALARAIGELRRGEVTVAAAGEAAGRLDGSAGARLRSLAAALEAYEGALARLGVLDRAGAARAAADAARRGGRSAETEGLDLLVVDGIAAASPAEWDLLAALAARARRTRFHVPWFADRPDASAPVEPLLRRIEALHDVAARREVEVVLPHAAGDGRAARPAAFLSALGGGRAVAPGRDGDGGLVLAEPGAGEAGEAGAIARVLARFADSGIPPPRPSSSPPPRAGSRPRSPAPARRPVSRSRSGAARASRRPPRCAPCSTRSPRRAGSTAPRLSGSRRRATSGPPGSRARSARSSTAAAPSTGAGPRRRRSAAARTCSRRPPRRASGTRSGGARMRSTRSRRRSGRSQERRRPASTPRASRRSSTAACAAAPPALLATWPPATSPPSARSATRWTGSSGPSRWPAVERIGSAPPSGAPSSRSPSARRCSRRRPSPSRARWSSGGSTRRPGSPPGARWSRAARAARGRPRPSRTRSCGTPSAGR